MFLEMQAFVFIKIISIVMKASFYLTKFTERNQVYFKNLPLLFPYLFYLMAHEISLFSI